MKISLNINLCIGVILQKAEQAEPMQNYILRRRGILYVLNFIK